jgi:hypothetical protein
MNSGKFSYGKLTSCGVAEAVVVHSFLIDIDGPLHMQGPHACHARSTFWDTSELEGRVAIVQRNSVFSVVLSKLEALLTVSTPVVVQRQFVAHRGSNAPKRNATRCNFLIP